MPSSPSLLLRSLPALLGVMLLAGPGHAENRIESVQVTAESTEEIVLTVVYSYAGDRGGNVAISAIMANDGKPSAHYAYRPGRVEPGRHRTRSGSAHGRTRRRSWRPTRSRWRCTSAAAMPS
jgi:hypothetical protein